MLELKDIHYSIERKEILREINLVIGEGEIHSIIGVNGTGKTTLAAILMGLNGYRPSRGEVLFNGKNITNFPITERAKLGITLAWQIPANFEGITVREYLSIKKNSVEHKKTLKLVGLNPDLYLDRAVDENLSGGERKRIELASVFSIKPKLVVLDEPDSGIDMASISAIKKMIKSFKKMGASVLLITHSEGMARIGDSVALLCNGKIVKEGDVKEVTEFFRKHCKECDHIGEIEEEILK
ncbi:MAG: ABC transporter ATP-binding protein [Candidatus Neomarinimicrobiota bacterium]|nr:MAG: ABC transporter ATP-binding protein [Candidatus Neomarinimicrobiota bacterium]